MSVAELLELFEVPRSHTIYKTLVESDLFEDKKAVNALGRALFPPSVHGWIEDAFRKKGLLSLGRPVVYVSMCSGLDLFTVVVQSLVPGAWRYAAACDTNSDIRKFLTRAYAAHGLVPSAVLRDATSPATQAAMPEVCDFLTCGSPCGEWSKRNKYRSETRMEDATRDVRDMLRYVVTSRPAVVVMENVDTYDTEIAISAELANLQGYDVVTAPVTADGQMRRDRRVWVATRRD